MDSQAVLAIRRLPIFMGASLMFCVKPKHFRVDEDGNITGDFRHVIVGCPDEDDSLLVALGMVHPIHNNEPLIHLRTETRFVPKILVELGLFKSNSEAIRQNGTWKVTFSDEERNFHVIRLAKNGPRQNMFVAIFVGPKSLS
jgi:hypothetical protein